MKYIKKFENLEKLNDYRLETNICETPNVLMCDEDGVQKISYSKNIEKRIIATVNVKDTYRKTRFIGCMDNRSQDGQILYSLGYEKIEIDGVEIPVNSLINNGGIVHSYIFNNTGEHTVAYTLKDVTNIIVSNSNNESLFGFFGCTDITNIVLPNVITSIGSRAFNCCYNLKSITIPESVTKIGKNAFYGCYMTADKFINNSSLDAAENNYWGCTILDSDTDGYCIKNNELIFYRGNDANVVIPNNVTSIGTESERQLAPTLPPGTIFGFSAANINSITIPASVNTIGQYAFYGCYITADKFINNSSLDAAGNNYWGAGIVNSDTNGYYVLNTAIDSSGTKKNVLMKYKGNELNVVIPNNIDVIGPNAFDGCIGLKNINISEGVTQIFQNAFIDCTEITRVVIPSTVTKIANTSVNAQVQGNTSNIFTSPIIYKDNFINNSSINAQGAAFFGAIVYDNIVNGFYMNGTYVLAYNSEQTDIIIPENTTEIINNITLNNISGITIPASMGKDLRRKLMLTNSFIKTDKFINNSSYDYINDESRPMLGAILYDTIDNYCFFKNNSFVYVNNRIQHVKIPNNVTSISTGAIQYNVTVKDVVIPSSVTKIGAYAFAECRNLKSITCYNMTAPELDDSGILGTGSMFMDLSPTGTLYIPKGATGYDAWLTELNADSYDPETYEAISCNWTIVEME